MVAEEDVAQARRNAAVHDGGDAVLLRQRIQLKRVFAEERDIHDVLAGLDDRLAASESP